MEKYRLEEVHLSLVHHSLCSGSFCNPLHFSATKGVSQVGGMGQLWLTFPSVLARGSVILLDNSPLQVHPPPHSYN